MVDGSQPSECWSSSYLHGPNSASRYDSAELLAFLPGLSEAKPGRNDKSSAESYREALFGPWRYEDDQHSLGWDPSTMKLGAFTYKAPTSMANAGVRAAVWLAFESLPLFPCFAGQRGRLQVQAFRHDRRDFTLCWPVWRLAISIETLRSLLGWEGLVNDTIPAVELEARGVT